MIYNAKAMDLARRELAKPGGRAMLRELESTVTGALQGIRAEPSFDLGCRDYFMPRDTLEARIARIAEAALFLALYTALPTVEAEAEERGRREERERITRRLFGP